AYGRQPIFLSCSRAANVTFLTHKSGFLNTHNPAEEKAMKLLRRFTVVLAVAIVSSSAALCQTWQPLANQPTFCPGAMLRLTDGTVLVHSEPNCLTCTSTDYSSWYKLMPDSHGSYVNGTW